MNVNTKRHRRNRGRVRDNVSERMHENIAETTSTWDIGGATAKLLIVSEVFDVDVRVHGLPRGACLEKGARGGAVLAEVEDCVVAVLGPVSAVSAGRIVCFTHVL